MSELEAALEAAGEIEALSGFREALAKGDKIAAVKIAKRAGLLSDP